MIKFFSIQVLLPLAVALLFFWMMTSPVFPQSPTPGTPSEWSEWLDEQEDVQEFQTGEFDPVNTYAGSYSVPRLFVKQSLKAAVAVEIELGYTEATSPIDANYIGGLRCQGETVTALTEPVVRLMRAGPGDMSSAKPVPKPGEKDEEGKVIADVIVSPTEIPGAVKYEAKRVSGIRLAPVVVKPDGKVAKVKWHPSYAVYSGPVWVKVTKEAPK